MPHVATTETGRSLTAMAKAGTVPRTWGRFGGPVGPCGGYVGALMRLGGQWYVCTSYMTWARVPADLAATIPKDTFYRDHTGKAHQ